MKTNYFQGLVIKIVDFQEQDHIIHLLTNEQILVFVALGTQKMTSKNRFALQIGNIINVEIFRARLKNRISKLKKAEIIFQPPLLVGDTAQVILTIISEINKMVASNQEHLFDIFKIIKNGWQYFGHDYNHHIKTYIIFHLLKNYGLKMELSCCVICRRINRINGFLFDQGGFTCVAHSLEKRNLPFLQAMNFLNKNMEKYLQIPPQINQQIYLELNNYLRDFASY